MIIKFQHHCTKSLNKLDPKMKGSLFRTTQISSTQSITLKTKQIIRIFIIKFVVQRRVVKVQTLKAAKCNYGSCNELLQC